MNINYIGSAKGKWKKMSTSEEEYERFQRDCQINLVAPLNLDNLTSPKLPFFMVLLLS